MTNNILVLLRKYFYLPDPLEGFWGSLGVSRPHLENYCLPFRAFQVKSLWSIIAVPKLLVHWLFTIFPLVFQHCEIKQSCSFLVDFAFHTRNWMMEPSVTQPEIWIPTLTVSPGQVTSALRFTFLMDKTVSTLIPPQAYCDINAWDTVGGSEY